MFKKYPKGNFSLTIEAGQYNTCEIIVLLGENGTGKTTFVNMLAGRDKEIKKRKIVTFLSLFHNFQSSQK